MIIDGPITFDLTLGQERRIPQEGDAQTNVPPVVAPVVLALRSTDNNPLTATVLTGSALKTVVGTQPPSTGATDSDTLNLPAGLWELELNMASWFDFTKAGGAVISAGIYIIYLGVNTLLLARYATIGSFNDYNRLRFLLRQPAVIGTRLGVTAAAQNITITAIINAIRIL